MEGDQGFIRIFEACMAIWLVILLIVGAVLIGVPFGILVASMSLPRRRQRQELRQSSDADLSARRSVLTTNHTHDLELTCREPSIELDLKLDLLVGLEEPLQPPPPPDLEELSVQELVLDLKLTRKVLSRDQMDWEGSSSSESSLETANEKQELSIPSDLEASPSDDVPAPDDGGTSSCAFGSSTYV